MILVYLLMAAALVLVGVSVAFLVMGRSADASGSNSGREWAILYMAVAFFAGLGACWCVTQSVRTFDTVNHLQISRTFS
jgi:hypothetical protein